MEADRDALAQLLEGRRGQRLAEAGLADQQDLHQLRLLGFEIREHPHFLERAPGEILRLVDDHHDAPAERVLIDQHPRQLAHHRRLGRRDLVDPEVDQQRLDELGRFEQRVDQARDEGAPVEAGDQRLEQRRLAASDLAGEDDEAGPRLEAEAQMVQRVAMIRTQVQVVEVRRQRERAFPQPIKAFVHRYCDPRWNRMILTVSTTMVRSNTADRCLM